MLQQQMGCVITTSLWQQSLSTSCRLAAAPSSPPVLVSPRPCRRKQRNSVLMRCRRKPRVACCATATMAGSQQQQHPCDDDKGSRRSVDNPAGFQPSVWGDFFLHYNSPTTPLQKRLMEERADKLKEEVAKMISRPSTSSLCQRLHLIYALQRLCLDYLFEEEINTSLAQISDADVSDCDLHTVSLWFYLLRSYGHRVSPDIFAAFKDEEGRFTWHDPRDILGLYNAAHLRTHGETILDEAISFTRRCLKSMVPYYLKEDRSFACEVTRTLAIPIPRRVRIYDYKYYISIYEKDTKLDRMVLELAKLNSNLMQICYQQELKLLTRWWMDLQLRANFSFTRDRIVENYFWMAGAYFEPNYSRGRIILTMVMATIVILDDIYDVYGSSQDCKLFTKCIECWDQNAAQDLPDNLKLVFGNVLENFETIEHVLEAHEKCRLSYVRNLLTDLMRAYIMEVKWRDERYIPATVDEHLQVSATTGACQLLCCASFVGMGEIATIESFDWVSNMPKMVRALSVLLRLSNDLAEPYQQEQISLNVPSTITSCMKEHNISQELAHEKIKELIEESWKDINDEWLKPDKAQPMQLLERILNLTRTMEFMYNEGDVFTNNHAIKDIINSLFVQSFSNI